VGAYEQWAERLRRSDAPAQCWRRSRAKAIRDRADDRYIVKTFDGFAESFNTQLARLDYAAPQLVAAR